ncbi:hypothetical protein GO491_03050 [Flavobacteriaceae bacterium Ap0902]|nr:hypothetical protein [Flavobacteriaceae bacterium Ap0902]
MKALILNFLLWLIAPILDYLFSIINVPIVFFNDWKKRGFKGALNGLANYFKESAVRRDIFCCAEYRTLWNATLKIKEGKKIGVNNRTLSEDVGQQDDEMTLSRTGALLNCFLFLLERNHCRKYYLKSINKNKNYEKFI